MGDTFRLKITAPTPVPLAIADGEEVPPDLGTAANVRGPTHFADDP